MHAEKGEQWPKTKSALELNSDPARGQSLGKGTFGRSSYHWLRKS
jgi:hypothetical protein